MSRLDGCWRFCRRVRRGRVKQLVALVIGIGGLVFAVWVYVTEPAGAYIIPTGLEGHTYPTVCPPRPGEPAEGATVTEAELDTIAQELADSCYRREQLHEADQLVLQAVDKDVQAVTGRLGEPLATTLLGEPTIKIGNWEAAPASSTVELSAPAKAQFDGNSSAIHADLWFVIGSILALGVGFVLYSELRPRG